MTYPLIRNGYNLKQAINNPSHIGKTNYKKESGKIIINLPKGWDTTVGFVRSMKDK